MTDYENKWDQRLRIQTVGRDDLNADEYRYPYEPTPYCVLERLANSGLIQKEDVVLDYGCGKGRVDLFLSAQTQANTIGIEYDEHIYRCALENQGTSGSGTKTNFVLKRAENCEVPAEVNRCYFFNPFSVEILGKVIAEIIQSCNENPREIFLFFYYPSDAYLTCLMSASELEIHDEIPCGGLFGGNDHREEIVIFSLKKKG